MGDFQVISQEIHCLWPDDSLIFFIQSLKAPAQLLMRAANTGINPEYREPYMANPATIDTQEATGFESRYFSKAFESLVLFRSGPGSGIGVAMGHAANGARFELDDDLSPLFPYINAVADQARYYEKPVYIKFLLDDRLCAFYPRQGAFSPVRDLSEAIAFLPRLLDFILDVARRRPGIVPSHKKYKPGSALDIYRLLPGSNCRNCGYATCMAFAAALSRQRTSMVKCPHLTRPLEEKATFPLYDGQGNLLRTVALDIDTACLRQKINQKEAHIKALEARLAALENSRATDFDKANALLPTPLTLREIQVLRRIVRGATNKEISKGLHISEHTVKSHVIHIFNKLGVNDRAQASAWGALNGLREGIHNYDFTF
jgi:DNA-binding CsgD family transcriptional regulator/ArsR family metal-binding transcriptional regulator